MRHDDLVAPGNRERVGGRGECESQRRREGGEREGEGEGVGGWKEGKRGREGEAVEEGKNGGIGTIVIIM